MAEQSLNSHWRKQMQTWRKSGLSQKEFCRKAGISFHQFSYWRTKFLREGEVAQESSFLPVKSTSKFSVSIGATRVSFDEAPSPSWMADFVRSFEGSDAHS